MKTIKIPLYTFSELEKETQETALEHFRYTNVACHWWESDYEDFINLCSTIGISVNPKEIYFRGFYSQGDGSCFASKVDLLAFIESMQKQTWKSYVPTLELNTESCPISPRIINLIEREVIEMEIWTETSHRYYFLHYRSQNYLYQKSNRDYIRIEEELTKLDKWAKKILERLNDHLYKSLEETYYYLTSDKAVQETIETNEYHFTANGVHTDWLCEYSEL